MSRCFRIQIGVMIPSGKRGEVWESGDRGEWESVLEEGALLTEEGLALRGGNRMDLGTRRTL